MAVLAFTAWAILATDFDPVRIYRGFFVKPFFAQFVAGLWPPNWTIMDEVLKQTLITIQIAWIGTLLAAFISVPLAFLAARNTAPAVAVGTLTRFLFNTDRSIDVMIVALVLVAAVGLGPLAGTIAIALHTVGAMGKLFLEAIESIDRGPVEALESTGATPAQVIRWAVIPQVLPYIISYFLYRLELNIRSAVVLGIVGAGGIGFLLVDNIKQFQYQNVSAILIVIVTLVMTIDVISARLRKAVV